MGLGLLCGPWWILGTPWGCALWFLGCQFTLSHSSPKHQLSLFEAIPSYTTLGLYDLGAYSSIDCEAESFSSLNYSTRVSALIYFDDSLLDRSDGWEDVIVMTKKRVKQVKKYLSTTTQTRFLRLEGPPQAPSCSPARLKLALMPSSDHDFFPFIFMTRDKLLNKKKKSMISFGCSVLRS